MYNILNHGLLYIPFGPDIENYVFGENVKDVGRYLFNGCKMTSLTIPSNVKRIQKSAISPLYVKKVIIPDIMAWLNVDYYDDDIVYEGTTYSPFNGNSSLYSDEDTPVTNLVIPEGVTIIRQYAFFGFTNIESITFPSTLTSIEYKAFGDCDGIKNLTIPSYVSHIGGCAFFSCGNLSSLTIEDGVKWIDVGAFSGAYRLEEVVTPSSVKTLGSSAFALCENLKTVDVRCDIETINQNTFKDCINLKSITIPSSIKTIGQAAFYNCKRLESIEIPNGLKLIDEKAFYICESLTSVTIPSSTEYIGDHAFSFCKSLTSVRMYIPITSNINSLSFYGNSRYGNCELYVPDDDKSYWKNKLQIAFNGGVYGLTEPRIYVVYSDKTLTFHYDHLSHTRNGEIYKSLNRQDEILWANHSSEIRKVVISPTFKNVQLTTTAKWFYGFKNLEEIDGLNYLNTAYVKSMYRMFSEVGSVSGKITVLDLSSFRTSRTTNMENMFYSCTSLKTIYVSQKWNLKNVQSSDAMFYSCNSLIGMDGTKFDSNYTDITKAYAGNGGYLTSLDQSSVKQAYAVYNDNTLSFYFDNLSAIRSGDVYTDIVRKKSGDLWGVHKLDVKRVVIDPSFADARPVSTAHWFNGCKNLEGIEGLEYLNTSNVTTMYAMFNGVAQQSQSIQELDLTTFDTSNVTDMSYMFNCCSSLNKIYVSDTWNIDNVETSDMMFNGCKKIVGKDGTKYNASNIDVAYAHHVHGGYLSSLISEPVPYVVYSDQTLTFYYDEDATYRAGTIFTELNRQKGSDQWGAYKTEITSVVIDPSFADYRPTSTAHWFNGFYNLVSITGLDYLNTSDVTDMYGMFNGVAKTSGKITELDLSSFDTSKVTDMKYMFNCCTSLKTILVSDAWTTANVEVSDNMFYNCKKITGGDGTTYYANYTDKTRAFAGLGGYLTKTQTNVKRHTYDDVGIEAATSVENTVVDSRNAETIYTMHGQLVGVNIDSRYLPKGIYIIDGKKVVIR